MVVNDGRSRRSDLCTASSEIPSPCSHKRHAPAECAVVHAAHAPDQSCSRRAPHTEPGEAQSRTHCRSQDDGRSAIQRKTRWQRIHRTFLPSIVVLLWLGILDNSHALFNASSPTISWLAPTAGHAVGGYLVSVYGQGFAADASRTYTCDFSCNANSGVYHTAYFLYHMITRIIALTPGIMIWIHIEYMYTFLPFVFYA